MAFPPKSLKQPLVVLTGALGMMAPGLARVLAGKIRREPPAGAKDENAPRRPRPGLYTRAVTHPATGLALVIAAVGVSAAVAMALSHRKTNGKRPTK